MKRRKSLPTASKVYRPEDLITQADAIALLAGRDRRVHDTDRTRKARMRQSISYATNKGVIVAKMWQSKKCYVFGRLAAWAQDEWPGKYSDLPALRDPNYGGLIGVLKGLSGGGSGYLIPATLAECQAQLHQVWPEVLSLREQLRLAREEADRLRPDAEASQRRRATNKSNAKLPRQR